MSWADSLTKGAEYVAGGFHAVPTMKPETIKNFPSMHRLLNVIGMVAGFSGSKYIADIIFGQKINGSQYQPIAREKVIPPLRFLHGIIHYNPFSDDPHDQWLKVLHQMIPAAGGAYGAIKGSEYFFASWNGTEKVINDIMNRKILHPLDAEEAVTFSQGKIWRIGAGLSAWMASVTGLTGILYGWTLNSAFLLCNRGKSFTGLAELTGINAFRKVSNNNYDSNRGPARALPRLISQFETFLKKAGTHKIDEAEEEMGRKVANAVFFPFFHKLTYEEKEQIVKHTKKVFHDAYEDYNKYRLVINTSNPEELYEAQAWAATNPRYVIVDKHDENISVPKEVRNKIEKQIRALLVDPEIMRLGEGMTAGNNGWLGKIAELFTGNQIEEIRKRTIGYRPPTKGI